MLSWTAKPSTDGGHRKSAWEGRRRLNVKTGTVAVSIDGSVGTETGVSPEADIVRWESVLVAEVG
jgi:hypothetical protein